MRIGQLAQLAGVTPRTVRHYHQIGLFPEPERRANGYREYTVFDLTKLLRIRHLVALGLPLDRIGALLEPAGNRVEDELAGLEQALRRQIAALTDQLDVVVAARASVLPEMPGSDGVLYELVRDVLSDDAARRLETDLTLLLGATDRRTQSALRAHLDEIAGDPDRGPRLARAARDLMTVDEATPGAERDRIAAEMHALAAGAPLPEAPNRLMTDLLSRYQAEAFTPAQLDVLRRMEDLTLS